ncbi:MAG: adenylyltransferase/cytidyltransferase family protein [Clostridia bacterium]|nr:adenylyltransferase/cytidyltransferase family protein [Clostridia bacterium]
MTKVITYGTFDLLHKGHINILKRAKALGDYLLVGVTTENFDVTRGKINVQQSLMERIEAVKQTGIADEVFPEEYVGQKIDDIKRHGVSIFAVGSDWEGHFDYLKEYCKVVYLPRTEGVSSTQKRSEHTLKIGAIGEDPVISKLKKLSKSVNGIEMNAIFSKRNFAEFNDKYNNFEQLLAGNDAVYVAVQPEKRYETVKKALLQGKHVICESPVACNKKQAQELFNIAKEKGLVLFDSIKTAYSTAFARLILLIKSGVIGEVKSIDITCTSLENYEWLKETKYYSSFTGWGAVALLPVFKLLGIDYENCYINTVDGEDLEDIFTKLTLVYDNALATVNVGVGVKSEGDMRISGTKGYVYVPAPWWKNGYFEIRYEDAKDNKPYFYENEGEGLQTELVHFLRCVNDKKQNFYIEQEITEAVSAIMEQFKCKR